MPTIRTPSDLVALMRSRRLELGESQAQFAARIRKTQSWVSDFERNVTPNIYLGTLLEVLSLAGFDLEAASRGIGLVTHQQDDDGDLALDFPDEPAGFAP